MGKKNNMLMSLNWLTIAIWIGYCIFDTFNYGLFGTSLILTLITAFVIISGTVAFIVMKSSILARVGFYASVVILAYVIMTSMFFAVNM
ncbi:hypothetical protein A2215_01975 [Candidatus Berkelbacteria bacterium RIFOXYA2_FULL_43_10]|uniref:Uncharacterized protein n=1 Tax=Candidatus Berkelbacteria bacterium RIFOXYA2_FULL_43_10 TaxID=1797472 RepID=A0A1F5E419_9BACT|nr:MAG: hypothetical protein A2215_01975 [Candidatus Berkelbacteria bacterium RIFOXYA2_FULL_43_10]